MSQSIMLALGDYRFSIDTAAHKTLQRSSKYRWQSQNRAGRKPALQYLGPDSDTIKLDGEILPHFRGGLGQVATMREQAGKGEPLILTDSDGNIWGKWCVVTVDETWNILTQDGKPRSIGFSLSLQEYGDDYPGGRL